MTRNWRIALIAATFVFLAWVGFEIGRAGNDVTIPLVTQPSTLSNGHASEKRLHGGSWSLDYDRAIFSADGSQAQISHVRDGRIHRAGKPDVHIKADDVTENSISGDLFITGPVTFTEDEGGGRMRTFSTVGARFLGGTRTLSLDHTATITDAGATVTVASMTIDFRTGETQLGRMVGEKPGAPQ